MKIYKPTRTTPRKRNDRTGMRQTYKHAYTFDTMHNIPSNIPLTKRAINHWKATKSSLGYTNYRTLYKNDVLSIASATKRGEAIMNVNRMGQNAVYKLLRY